MMKKIFFTAVMLLQTLFSVSLAQDVKVVKVDEIPRIPDASERIKPIDTIDTDDKFLKRIIYDNYTWDYLELERPVIDTTGMFDGWDTEGVHAFRNIPLDSLPAEIPICIYDDVNPYAIPYVGRISSTFKFRHGVNHNGTDIPLVTGDTVRCAFNGIVRFSNYGKASGGYGGLIIVRHPNGLETYYAHLSKRLVKEGDEVAAGEAIGLGGSTGHSTGPHLHFETRYMGKAFDPERIFDFTNGTIRDSSIILKKHYFNINSHYGMSDELSEQYAKKKPISTGTSSGKVYYKVRKGDTLSKIASRYGTTVAKICKLNGISAKKPIPIGKTLRVK